MHKAEPIPVGKLLIDIENPRLEGLLQDQRAAVCAVAFNQGQKLAVLAKDIVEHGLDPSASLIVTPLDEDRQYYVVLEGNRRLAALKILEEPGLISGAVEDAIASRFRKLSAEYKDHVKETRCIVFGSRADAAHWIELRHTGENEGAGIVKWGGKETARFRQRSGQKAPHLQVLDFLETRGHIDKATSQRVRVTSLKRLLGDPYVRERLGIDLRSGAVVTCVADGTEAVRGLRRIVEDIASGIVPVKKIYTKDDRRRYIDSLPLGDLPATSELMSEFRPLGSPPGAPDQKQPARKPKTPRPAKRRSTLIPRDLVLSIDQSRIDAICRELRKLNIEEYANAVSVLFRVFMELSADAYINRWQLSTNDMAKLGKKLLDVGENLKDQDKLDDQQLKPVRRAAQGDSFLATTISTMHQYVHNQFFHPSPSDLVAAWDSLQPFIEAIWS